MDVARIKTGSSCNNNCLFCFNKAPDIRNKSTDELKKELSNLKKDYNNISFAGGETTIRDDFFELINYARELRFERIKVESNGRIFSSKEFSKKASNLGVKEFCVSLYGYCKEQHDYLTKTPGSFKQTIKGIKNLLLNDLEVTVNILIVKPNYRDLLKMVRVLEMFQIKRLNLEFVAPDGRAFENFEKIIPRFYIVSPYIKRTIDLCIKKNIKIAVTSIPPCFLEYYEQYIIKRNDERVEIKFEKCKKCKFTKICSGVPEAYAYKINDMELDFLRLVKQKPTIFNEIAGEPIKN